MNITMFSLKISTQRADDKVEIFSPAQPCSGMFRIAPSPL